MTSENRSCVPNNTVGSWLIAQKQHRLHLTTAFLPIIHTHWPCAQSRARRRRNTIPRVTQSSPGSTLDFLRRLIISSYTPLALAQPSTLEVRRQQQSNTGLLCTPVSPRISTCQRFHHPPEMCLRNLRPLFDPCKPVTIYRRWGACRDVSPLQPSPPRFLAQEPVYPRLLMGAGLSFSGVKFLISARRAPMDRVSLGSMLPKRNVIRLRG